MKKLILILLSVMLATVGVSAASEDIPDIIERNLDVLVSEPYRYMEEEEIICAYPEAFYEILTLGDAAIPYLEEVADDSFLGLNQTWKHIMRGTMANYIADILDPERKAIYIPSMDGRYSLKMVPHSYMDKFDSYVGTEYDAYLVVHETDSILPMDPSHLMRYTSSMDNLSWEGWSPDSRYVMFSVENNNFHNKLFIYSVEDSCFFQLPAEKEIEEMLGQNMHVLPEDGEDWAEPEFIITEWDADVVKVHMQLWSLRGGYPGIDAGYYRYDLKKQEIVELQYTIESSYPDTPVEAPRQPEPQIPHLALKIMKNVDILTSDAVEGDTAAVMIHRHPEAYEEILSFGKQAGRYLIEYTWGNKENAPKRVAAQYLYEELQRPSAEVMAEWIDQNLDRIAAAAAPDAAMDEIIAAAPDAYAKIIDFGDAALPHLREIIEQYPKDGSAQDRIRTMIAHAAQYAILPNLYEIQIPSPYGTVRVTLQDCDFTNFDDPLRGIAYRKILISDGETYHQTLAGTYYNTAVYFSEDNRYIVLRNAKDGVYSRLQLCVPADGTVFDLPDESILDAVIRKKYPVLQKDTLYQYHTDFERWVGTDRIKVGLWYQYETANKKTREIYGYYIYDVEKQEISRMILNRSYRF